MKTPALLLPLLAFVLGASPLVAGISIKRSGDQTTAVPLSSYSAADLDLPARDILDAIRALPTISTNPFPAEDLAELRKHAPFNAFPDDQTIIDRFHAISEATVDSIEVINRGDDYEVGTALAYTLNNRRISLAFGGMPGEEDTVRDDGSATYGAEAINLHWVPQPLLGETQIHLHDPDGFRLTHSLGKLGRYMVTPGYEIQPPQSSTERAAWALTNQLRSLTVGSNAVAQLHVAVEVFSGIATNLGIPTNTAGISRSIGRQLLRDTALTDEQKKQKARNLLAYIQGELLPREEWNLGARVYYRDTLDLTLKGRLNGYATYNDPFKQAAYFVDTVRKPGSGHPYTTYFGGGASIANPDTMPVIDVDNRFWRVSGTADGAMETETFTVDELAGISLGGFDGTRLYVGGPSLDLGQFICFGYLDEDGDGRVEAGTKRQLFTSDHLKNGAHLAWNPVTGDGTILDRRTGGLYGMDFISTNTFPTGISPRGSIGTDLTDAWRLGISLDGKWALGYPEFSGTLAPYYQHTESYFDDTKKEYGTLRLGYSYEEVKLGAAIAGPLVESMPNSLIRFSGTPDTEYVAEQKLTNTWKEIVRATTDPNGHGFFYIPGTDTVLKIGGYVRFATEFGDDRSPEYAVTKNPVLPEIVSPSLSRKGGDIRLPYIAEPYSRLNLLRSTTLAGFSEVDAGTTTPFGTGIFKDCLLVPTGIFYAWQLQLALAAVLGFPDYYYLPVGVTRTLYPGWNDRIFRGTTFALDPVTGPAAALMALATMDAYSSVVRATVASFSNTTLNYRLFQDGLFKVALVAVVVQDLIRSANPPVIRGADGQDYVTVGCLVIGGKNYPIRPQFRLANPEPLDPITGSGCLEHHWHGNRVYHIDNDTVGITDPLPHNCGFGPFLSVPQAEVTVPFSQWRAFRAWLFFGTPPAPAAPNSLDEAVCGPEPVKN